MLGPARASPGRSASSCASASGAKAVPQKTGAARLRDATDDPTHGEQEGSFYYRGYHETHMYHPLVVFDGETNRLPTAVSRAGNTHASRGALSVSKRVVKRPREAWPGVEVEIRADAGFAVPRIYEYCEQEGIDHTISASFPIPGSRRWPSPCSRKPSGGPRRGRREPR